MKRYPVTLPVLISSIVIMLAGLTLFLRNQNRHQKITREISRLSNENLELRHLNLAHLSVLMPTSDSARQIPSAALLEIQNRASKQLENDRRLRNLEKIEQEYSGVNQLGVGMLCCSVLFLAGFNFIQFRRRFKLLQIQQQDQETMELLRETIREKSQVQEDLLKEKERLNFVLEGTNAATWEWNIQTGELIYNETWASLIGYRLEEIQPINDKTLARFAHPDDLAEANTRVSNCLRDQSLFYEATYRMKHKDGHWVWILDRGKVVRSTENGEPLQMFGTHVDISPLKESNEELTRFASVASHDMKEPLRMISSFMRLLQKNYGDVLDAKANQYIHYAMDGAERMTALIKELLEYAHAGGMQVGKREWVNCTELLNQIAVLNKAQLDEQHAVLHVGKLPVVHAGKTPLKLVFQNLISNALKYQHPGIDPVIEITASEDTGFWQFSVSDNGIGIPTEHREEVFHLFKRLQTKHEYTGSGMGLATCKRIVEQHGGKIWIDDNGSTGTILTFTIRKTA
ncbi:sensor histidine kinase [Flavihumibacter sp. UBA7668]|uniref:sensor histidine kinase n=1 Tax=Flavihumibacter sp. UBA7668 TaxID=1946542 RepID=UPI0025C1C607|nr:PAS domain-containing sensor histidine kinase [Flavihumibacter sp. UBA7668]